MADKKITITYLIDFIGWAGAQTHLISILNNIDYQRFNVCVICLRFAGTKFPEIESLPVQTKVFELENLMNLKMTIKTMLQIRRLIRENNTDIFQSYMFNPNLMASLVSWIPFKKHMLVTTRRDMGYWHQEHHWWLYRFMNVVTKKVIAVSEQVRKKSIKKEGLNPDKIITIHNGISNKKYTGQERQGASLRKKYNIKEDEFVIGILAALRPEKRHDVFIEAAKIISDKIPGARFMVVGEGYDETKKNIDHLLEKYKLKDKFVLTGKLENVIPALSAFDISVLCSDSEGMSNTMLESIAMGKVVVATAVGGNIEVLENNINGILVAPGRPDEIAAAVLDLYQNQEKRLEIQVQARKTAQEKFEISHIIKQLEATYLQLVGN